MSGDETWFGGFYEAAIVLGKSQSVDADKRLRSALAAIWAHPSVRVAKVLDLSNLEGLARVEGRLDHPRLGSLAFATIVVREQDTPNGDDWLYAGVPMGSLEERVADVDGWPAGDHPHSQHWREPLEHSLAELALSVTHAVPISLAMIGYEISGLISDFNPDGPRRIGFVVRGQGGEFSYWPTTDWS